MASSGPWQEVKASDGRTYYFNKELNKTTWDKPVEMMSPEERALANTPWKLYKALDGRTYYYNTETKITSWEFPQDVKGALSTPAQQPPPTPTMRSGRDSWATEPYRGRDRDRDDYRPPGHHAPAAFVSVLHNEYEYVSAAEGEDIFFKMLQSFGVEPDWTWEQTMRTTVFDPRYRAVKDARLRKAAFEKFIADARTKEMEREKDRQAKARADFTTMLKRHPEIYYYTRWKTIRPILEGETMFRSARDEDERIELFNDYRNELYKEYLDAEAENRRAAEAELSGIFAAMDLPAYTRWTEAREALEGSVAFKTDPKFESLYPLDILEAWQSHVKQLEITFNAKLQEEKALKVRKARKNRDAFKQLLQELNSAGKIKAGTKWTQIHPFIEDDPRYDAILGQQGSSPLDLFFDMVAEEERILKAKRVDVVHALEKRKFEIAQKTSFDEFLSVVQTDRLAAQVDRESLAIIFDRLHEKTARKVDSRRGVDALRSRIKHLDPPVAVTDNWEQIRPRVEKTDEFRSLDSEDLRRSAFDKHMRRLREKEQLDDRDRERDGGKIRHRDDRDRERRNGQDRHHRTRTRTPESDPYEADRKKAQADRERQYSRKSDRVDRGIAGLSPPPPAFSRDGDHYEPRRDGRLGSGSYYDRERREREADRERNYVNRKDPRDVGSELDYGDGGSAGYNEGRGGRRRRESDGSSPRGTRDSKRARRSKTPVIPKEDPGVKSGSEEGEIEET